MDTRPETRGGEDYVLTERDHQEIALMRDVMHCDPSDEEWERMCNAATGRIAARKAMCRCGRAVLARGMCAACYGKLRRKHRGKSQ